MGIFSLFYFYLSKYFTAKSVIVGLLLLQIVIPLSVTGVYMEGEFLALFFYILGLNLIFSKRENYLPLVVGISTLNREQMIFLVVFYVAYLISEKRLFQKRSLRIIIFCIASYTVALFGIIYYFGFRQSDIYAITLHVARNSNVFNLLQGIIPLWLANFAGFLLLSIMAFRRTIMFFRLLLVSLVPYVMFFTIGGFLWEMAKFIPAYLVLIPMSLQSLTGEYTLKRPRN